MTEDFKLTAVTVCASSFARAHDHRSGLRLHPFTQLVHRLSPEPFVNRAIVM